MPRSKVRLEVEIRAGECCGRRKDRCRRHARRKRCHRDPCHRSRYSQILAYARRLARRCARQHPVGFCTSDDVHEALGRHGHGPSALGCAAGLVFRGAEWLATRFRVRSRRPSSRGREIKIWCLKRVCPAGGSGNTSQDGRPVGNGASPSHLVPSGILIHDHRSFPGFCSEASTDDPRTCSLCSDLFSSCPGFCNWFPSGGPEEEGRKKS